ncbi:signal peptidase I [Phenylobacterium immobile]|uniref:signal peptidase I n=1 Tax=Phenylobacterium immobile TaxID=21 RepID=UPI000A624287|nr:signal peptidase I [Phenylobacterium immobile]
MSDHAKAGPSGALGEILEIGRTVLYALAIALFLRVLFFQPFTIPSASMEPNLYEGDYIIVSKFSYGYSRHSAPFSPPLFKGRVMEKQPRRGDVVVFKLPSDGRTDYIKRVIGLPGDRIQMQGGLLYLNGVQIKRTPAGTGETDTGYGIREVGRFQETMPDGRTYMTDDYGTDGDLDDTPVYVVPEGHYFMMGDNRDNSLDSRVAPEAGGVGFVPAENLVGRAQIILLSWSPGASLFKPWTWILNARPSRFAEVLK